MKLASEVRFPLRKSNVVFFVFSSLAKEYKYWNRVQIRPVLYSCQPIRLQIFFRVSDNNVYEAIITIRTINSKYCSVWILLYPYLQGGSKENRTHENFIKSYKVSVNFKYFAGFKLQSVYNHSPKVQSLKSLRIKVMFFPKYASSILYGVGGKLAYVVQNCQLLEHILLWVFQWFCTVFYSLSLWIQSNDGAWRHWNFLRKLACTALYELLAK